MSREGSGLWAEAWFCFCTEAKIVGAADEREGFPPDRFGEHESLLGRPCRVWAPCGQACQGGERKRGDGVTPRPTVEHEIVQEANQRAFASDSTMSC